MLLLQKENQVNQIIPDEGGLMNVIKVNQYGAVEAIKVKINIAHPYIGDLKVDLIGPSGTSVTLHDREDGATQNLVVAYEGEKLGAFMGQEGNGDWTIAIQDFAPRDEGALVSWGIELRCEQEKSEIFIPDDVDSWLVSEQKCEVHGIIEEATLMVDIEHSYIGDLVIKLVAPDGEGILLRNREGGATNNLKVTYDMEVLNALKGKSTSGTWCLKIQDKADGDQGTLKHWKLGFGYQRVDDLSKITGLSEAQIATLKKMGIHSFNRFSTLGTNKLKEVFELNNEEANALLDAVKETV